jgi:mannan endo-1,4-beta-mannosidase
MTTTARAAALLLLALAGCARPRAATDAAPAGPRPSDPQATREARALFANLKRLEGTQVMFGHHDDLAYGHEWFNQPGRSDVKEASGSYPAVYGWELGNLEYEGATEELDRVKFVDMRRWIMEGYGRGALVTLSWHMGNPITGRNAWDTTSAVAAVLPGGAKHDEYVRRLDRFANFVNTLRAPSRTGTSKESVPIPMVFRPFHEMSGGWFWWGAGHATPEQYRQLWRFTADYLRGTRGLHNLLWAYSPDVFASPDDYLTRYPGDDYVDVLGFDDYQSVRSPATRDVLVRRLREVVTLADARGKVPALTETGVESVPDSTWFTGTLLPAIAHDSLTRRIAWVSLWRNAPKSPEHPKHFFAAYRGHPSAPDLARLKRDPLVVFEDELPDLYRAPR